jgi:hypothetical protein
MHIDGRSAPAICNSRLLCICNISESGKSLSTCIVVNTVGIVTVSNALGHQMCVQLHAVTYARIRAGALCASMAVTKIAC